MSFKEYAAWCEQIRNNRRPQQPRPSFTGSQSEWDQAVQRGFDDCGYYIRTACTSFLSGLLGSCGRSNKGPRERGDSR